MKFFTKVVRKATAEPCEHELFCRYMCVECVFPSCCVKMEIRSELETSISFEMVQLFDFITKRTKDGKT